MMDGNNDDKDTNVKCSVAGEIFEILVYTGLLIIIIFIKMCIDKIKKENRKNNENQSEVEISDDIYHNDDRNGKTTQGNT